MLAVTDQAATAIDDIIAAGELPEEAGVRITTEVAPVGESAPGPRIQMEIVEAPEPEDQVLAEAPVFVEPEAAALLDDKLLDAQLSGEKVQFALKQQG